MFCKNGYGLENSKLVTKKDILFGIVSRVCEEARVNPAFNPISAANNNPIRVCMEEIVVE